MTYLNTINIGNTDYGLNGINIIGACNTPAGNITKECNFNDLFELKAGVSFTVKFTYGNTYGDGSTTYPRLSIGNTVGAIRSSNGAYAGSGAWQNNALVSFLFDGTDFIYNAVNVTDTVASNSSVPVSSKGVYSAISSEATTRADADSELSTRITTNANAILTLQQNVSSVTTTANNAARDANDATIAATAASNQVASMGMHSMEINFYTDLDYTAGYPEANVSLDVFLAQVCSFIGLGSNNPKAVVNLFFTSFYNGTMYNGIHINHNGTDLKIRSYTGILDYNLFKQGVAANTMRASAIVTTYTDYSNIEVHSLITYKDAGSSTFQAWLH